MTVERSGAYSINDEYPINDCFDVSLIGYGAIVNRVRNLDSRLSLVYD